MLKINNLSKLYYGKKVIDNFSMTVSKGEIVGLIGKNGAGKTTILNCLAGNIFFEHGEILYNDKTLTSNSKILNTFGFLIDGTFLEYLNTYENLKLLCYASGVKDLKIINSKIDEVLTIVGLQNEKKSYVSTFSFGMKQRLSLAQSLLNCENFLILDEPLVGLDALGREIVKKVIRQKAKEGIPVLFSDHNLQEVQNLSDRIVCIENGVKIYDGIFSDKHHYCIMTYGQTHCNIENILDTINEHIIIKENCIIIQNQDSLNKVFTWLIQNKIIVKDIVIQQDSLINFFTN